MAEFLIDEQQFTQIMQSIEGLSNNIGKWQAKQTEVIQTGLTGLIAAVTGADIDEIQAKVNQLTSDLKSSTDEVESAINEAQTQKGSE